MEQWLSRRRARLWNRWDPDYDYAPKGAWVFAADRAGGQPRVKKNQQFLTFFCPPFHLRAEEGVTAAGKLACHRSENGVVFQQFRERIDLIRQSILRVERSDRFPRKRQA